MSAIIDPQLAKTLIQAYQAQNSRNAENAIKTVDGQNLNGYYIDRASLEAVLKNPAFTGVSVYFAKHPDAAASIENIITIIFVGAEPNPKWVEGSTTETKYINSGDAYDSVPPCPFECGTLGK